MESLLTVVLGIAGFAFLFLACFGWGQPRAEWNIQHWSHNVQGLSELADLFYARVYQRLKERLNQAQLPDSKVGFGPGHLFGNGTIFGARPRYLIIRYDDLVVYLYAFPLPTGLFVSYWAFSKQALWLEHPLLKYLVAFKPSSLTLYRFDVTEMCLTLIHSAVQEVLDEYAEERGLKPLEEYERRPVLQSFYAKYKQGGVIPTNYGQSGYVMPLPATMPLPTAMPLPSSGPAPHLPEENQQRNQ